MPEIQNRFHPEFSQRETVLSTGIHVLEIVSEERRPLEAIVFGGSYAQGKYKHSEDLDVDFYWGECDLINVVTFAQVVAT
ncbi:MAG: hypothetical protein V1810_04740 [Candidatus Beckwithbacteria bacterium]